MDSARMALKDISREVHSAFRELDIHFIIYHEGQSPEAMGLAAQEILGHPATEQALEIMKKAQSHIQEGLIGIATAQKNNVLGTQTGARHLALCALNIDRFQSAAGLRHAAWHHVWHALDKSGSTSAPTYFSADNKSKAVNSDSADTSAKEDALKNALALARANLNADIFATLTEIQNGISSAIGSIARLRARAALECHTREKPEAYPFILALDSIQTNTPHVSNLSANRRNKLQNLLRLSHNISESYDDNDIKGWISFVNAAQNMAWRGQQLENIINAAINMAQSTEVRLIGHQVAEILGYESEILTTDNIRYNSFMPFSMAEKQHIERALFIKERVFEHAARSRDSRAFYNVANQQNMLLADGEILGWCADALQKGGAAYDLALKSDVKNRAPLEKAAEAFDDAFAALHFKTLQTINKRVIRERREGATIALVKLLEICEDIPDSKTICRAIKQTDKATKGAELKRSSISA